MQSEVALSVDVPGDIHFTEWNFGPEVGVVIFIPNVGFCGS